MIQVKRFALCLVERGPSQCLLLWLNPFSDSTPALISMEYSFYHYGFVNLGPTVSDVIKLTFSWSYLIFFACQSLDTALICLYLLPKLPLSFLEGCRVPVLDYSIFLLLLPVSRLLVFRAFLFPALLPCRVQRQLSEMLCFQGRSSEAGCAWKMPFFYPDMLVASDFPNFQCSNAAFGGYDAVSPPSPPFKVVLGVKPVQCFVIICLACGQVYVLIF